MIDINNLPPRLSVEEIRKLRTCHPSTISRARKLGQIQGYKIGKTTWLYDRDSILGWLHLAEPEPLQERPAPPSKRGRPRKKAGK